MPRPKWSLPLTRAVKVKGGIVLRTLGEARHFASTDNPFELRAAWQKVAELLMVAAETERVADIEAATKQIEFALIDDGRRKF
jgi:hypothetical protein